MATVADAKLGTLALAAFRRLKATLAEGGSFPNAVTQLALLKALETMEQALEGRLPPRFYLSSIDTGMGKSRAIGAFLSVFVGRGCEPDNGVLVCLATWDEVKRMVEVADLPADAFAVLTSNSELNALGKLDHVKAPILFTTHQMVRERRKSPEAFDYRGRSRSLKIWDEGMTPADPVTVARDDLGKLLSSRLYAPELVAMLDTLIPELGEAKFGSWVTLQPALVDASAVASRHRGIPAPLRNMLRDLASVGGQPLLVVDDGGTGKALAGVRGRLPSDFAPAVILDASGRISGVYSLWEEHRGNLVRLPSAANNYRDVEVSVWRRKNGREAYLPSPERDELLAVIADLINRDRDSRWLIFHYIFDETFGDDLRALIEANAKERVHTLAWGSHRATNEYRDIPNVVVTGQLTYRRSAYLALAMATSGLPAQKVLELDLRSFAADEFAAHLQQAIGRSTVRQSKGGIAGAARAFVVLSPKSSADIITRALPGARVAVWKERRMALRGKVAMALDYLVGKLSDPSVEKVPKGEVREFIGIRETGTFGTNIMGHRGFRAALTEWGIVVRHRHFERLKPEPD